MQELFVIMYACLVMWLVYSTPNRHDATAKGEPNGENIVRISDYT